MMKCLSLVTPGILVPCLALVAIVASFPTDAAAFSIERPAALSAHRSDRAIAVVINVGDITGITAVEFYWYGEQEDMLEALGDDTVAGVATSPPFGMDVRPPVDAIGDYRLLAVATQDGRQAGDDDWAVFDEVLLHIRPHSPLRAIEFQTDKPLTFGRATGARVYDQLDMLGTTMALPVAGRFADGTVRAIRRASTGTTYHVDHPDVVTIDDNGRLRLTGNGAATLTVRHGDVSNTLDVLVDVTSTPHPNRPPVAHPGSARTIASGETVILDGLRSYDPEGGSLRYHWAQIRGSKVALLDPYAANARFFAPWVVAPRLFRFLLRVTDAQGADSTSAWVDIVVEP